MYIFHCVISGKKKTGFEKFHQKRAFNNYFFAEQIVLHFKYTIFLTYLVG